MNFVDRTLALFDELGDTCCAALREGEELALGLAAEDQTYLRLNGARVRQATAVEQRRLNMQFQSRGRRVAYAFDLGGTAASDAGIALSLLARARREVEALPADPFLTPIQALGVSDERHAGEMPEPGEVLATIREAGAAGDLTGLYAAGPQLRATRNSAGTRHAYASERFFLDYSLYTVDTRGENKAVKDLHAGRQWQAEALASRIEASQRQLGALAGASRELAPGDYRAYLAPAAVDALVAMFSWGAVSYGASRRGDSALSRLIEGTAALSPLFTLRENFALGLCPRFNGLGEMAPLTVPVIEQGRLGQLLTSTRSAREYGVAGNAADPGEGLRSPELAPGTLADEDVLSALDTGLYIGNLHYLNWSGLQHARLTGMTRYACFWVEGGRIVAPIRDLRFDESLYRLFGAELEAVTASSETLLNTDTYGQRALGGSQVPGILARRFRFTL
ncbi:TldD/PmbA family protein [Methyloparacoccus murrellii]